MPKCAVDVIRRLKGGTVATGDYGRDFLIVDLLFEGVDNRLATFMIFV